VRGICDWRKPSASNSFVLTPRGQWYSYLGYIAHWIKPVAASLSDIDALSDVEGLSSSCLSKTTIQHFLNDFLCERKYFDNFLVIGVVAGVLVSLTRGCDGAEGVVEGIGGSVGEDLWIVSLGFGLVGLLSRILYSREETL